MRFAFAFSSAVAVLLTASHGHAASINLATGLDSGGVLQTTGDALDANWQVTGAVNPKSPPSAFVVGTTTADAGFGGGWIANGRNSSWIAANPDDTLGNGLEIFTRTFTVTNSKTAAIINGAWTIDDAGSLFLNGHLLSTLSLDFNGPVLTHTTQLNPFTTTPSDFVRGVNTPTMVITSTDDFIEGARLEGTLITHPTGHHHQHGGHNTSLSVADSPLSVPETPLPAALPLFATGLGALGLLGWRRKRKLKAA
jgi:hypothetical protein